MKIARAEFLDLGGGQNDGLDPSQIKDSECEELINFYTYGRSIRRRGGIERLTATAHAEAVTSLFSFRNSDTLDWTLFVGLAAGLGRKDGMSIAKLTVSDGQVYSSDPDSPWTMEAYANIGYAVRRASGRMKRFTVDSMFDAGIAAPTVAVSAADAGAGSLPAGTYRYVVTLFNTLTGAESDFGPVSAPVTIGASRGITVSAIPTAVPALQVNARRLWRTLADQEGEYFLVATIADNVTTSYLDNVLTLGEAVSRRNGLPPNAKYMAFWNERCILSDGFFWYPSEIGLPESFGGTAIGLFPDDGHQIRALRGWADRLVVGKPNIVAYYLETENSFERRILSDKHGIWSHWSTRVVEDQLLWYGGDNFYRSAGGPPAAFSTYKIRKVLDEIPDARKEDVFCAVYPKRSWYLASVPTPDGGRKQLCYNYKTDSWSVFTTPDAFGFVTDAFDANETETIYGALSNTGHIYQLDHGTKDYGTAITARARFKRDTFGAPGLLRALVRAKLLCSTLPAYATLRVFRNGETAPVKERTVSLNIAQEWKTYALSNRRRPGSSLQFEIEYAAVPELTLDGLAFDVLDTTRRSMRSA